MYRRRLTKRTGAAAIAAEEGKPMSNAMSNDRRRCLASLVCMLVAAPACVQRDRLHGAALAPPAKADAESGQVPDVADSRDAAGGTPDPDATPPSLDGHWDLVANHDNATGTTTPVESGTAVVHYQDGVVELYLSDGTTKGCASQTYTLQGNTITYADGGQNLMEVTDTTLRLTTLKNGAPIGYSDFVRLAAFSPGGYGLCQRGGSGADAGQPSVDAQGGPVAPDGPVGASADGGSASLYGYWDLVSTYSTKTATTTPIARGTTVVYFDDRLVALYLDDGVTKSCGQSSYTVQGTTIIYSGGNTDSLVLTETTLRLTTLQAGGPFGGVPGDYSDFVRLASFSPTGYGPCP
jgi:hypothetical protein